MACEPIATKLVRFNFIRRRTLFLYFFEVFLIELHIYLIFVGQSLECFAVHAILHGHRATSAAGETGGQVDLFQIVHSFAAFTFRGSGYYLRAFRI